mgnify:CR=1 FL=1
MKTVRVAAVIFINNKLLLVEHQKPNMAYWVLPGGKLEPGESIEECAEREIREECRITVKVTGLLAAGRMYNEQKDAADIFLNCTHVAGTPALGTDPEAGKDASLSDLRLVPRNDFRSLRLYPPALKPLISEHWSNLSSTNGFLLGRY